MAFKMRQSKFRHVFGTPHKKDQCYDNIKISKSSLDATFCSVNPKYVAIVTEAGGGGAFLVLPLAKTGRVERDHPQVIGHKSAVLDVKWCPHNDDVIASCSEDCTVKIWQIPDEGVLIPLTDSICELAAHQRRVHLIQWHPTAQNLLLSASDDNKLLLWNVGTEELLIDYDMPDKCFSLSFNYDGTRFATTCKDKKLRVFNTRSPEAISEGKCHDGSKPAQCVYVKNDQVFTTGFSKMSERQYALWNANDLSKEKGVKETIDNSNGVIFPFYDADTGMVWLCGKGDSIIRFYEVTEQEPYVHYLSLHQSKEAQRGIGYMPKRGLNVNSCEIARFYKLLNNGLCEVIPFTVPRKSELFQDDLYPDTAADIPALSADEFMEGKKDSSPVMISLKTGYVPTKKEKMSAVRKSNALENKLVDRPVKKVEASNGEPAAPVVLKASHDFAPQARTAAPAPVAQAPAGPALPAGRTESKPARRAHQQIGMMPASVSQPVTVAEPAPVTVAKQPPVTVAQQPPVTNCVTVDFDGEKIMKDIDALKTVIKNQDKKIAALETRLEQLETSANAKPDTQSEDKPDAKPEVEGEEKADETEQTAEETQETDTPAAPPTDAPTDDPSEAPTADDDEQQEKMED